MTLKPFLLVGKFNNPYDHTITDLISVEIPSDDDQIPDIEKWLKEYDCQLLSTIIADQFIFDPVKGLGSLTVARDWQKNIDIMKIVLTDMPNFYFVSKDIATLFKLTFG